MSSVRIGCASAFWGDTASATAQLVLHGRLDYLVYDYLSEITMSILAAKRRRDPNAGYADDFTRFALTPAMLAQIKERGIRVISNAGGINPAACGEALAKAAADAGIGLKIAVVSGDDLMPRLGELAGDIRPLEGNDPLPGHLVSMNAYFGVPPIVTALDNGADIVITGRCVDSALALAPSLHEFGWSASDYDRLAQGSLAGHLIECGAQCTGGNFTDWKLAQPGYADMGFPIAEVESDGSFVITKPEGTGGLVTPHTVAEQMLYEIGDPRAYLLPDVSCNFTQVTMQQAGPDRVRVSGATGLPPNADYKVSATYADGYRCNALFMVGGIDAPDKAHAIASAIIAKTAREFATLGLGKYSAVDIEALGAESMYGENARAGARATREVMLKLAVQHPSREALTHFTRELAQAATAMAPGITGFFGGRPSVSPVIRLYSCLIPKARVPATVGIGDTQVGVTLDVSGGFDPAAVPAEATGPGWTPDVDAAAVPLIRLALARSGDKGDHGNIGVIARDPAYLPYVRAALTDTAVKAYFAHMLEGEVRHWELPGTHSFNFLLKHALGGGGIASLRADPQGKCLAQMLLDFPIPVPKAVADSASQPTG